MAGEVGHCQAAMADEGLEVSRHGTRKFVTGDPLTPRAHARCPLPPGFARGFAPCRIWGEREKFASRNFTSPLVGEVASGSERVRGFLRRIASALTP